MEPQQTLVQPHFVKVAHVHLFDNEANFEVKMPALSTDRQLSSYTNYFEGSTALLPTLDPEDYKNETEAPSRLLISGIRQGEEDYPGRASNEKDEEIPKSGVQKVEVTTKQAVSQQSRYKNGRLGASSAGFNKQKIIVMRNGMLETNNNEAAPDSVSKQCSTQRIPKEMSPSQSGARRASNAPYAKHGAKKKTSNSQSMKAMIQLGSKLSKLNGQVSKFHSEQEGRELQDQKFRQQQIDNSLKEQIQVTQQYLQQPTIVEMLPVMDGPIFKTQQVTRAGSRVCNADIYNEFMNSTQDSAAKENHVSLKLKSQKERLSQQIYGAGSIRTSQKNNTSAKKSIASLSEHQLEKLQKLQASRTQRIFQGCFVGGAGPGNGPSNRQQLMNNSKISSVEDAAHNLTKESDLYGPIGRIGSKNIICKNLDGSGEEHQLNQLLQSMDLSESPTQHLRESTQPQIITNLQNSLSFKSRLPISEENMNKYRQASNRQSTKRVSRDPTRIIQHYNSDEINTQRGPTPLTIKENPTMFDNNDLQEVFPTTVVIGQKKTGNRKKVVRKLDSDKILISQSIKVTSRNHTRSTRELKTEMDFQTATVKSSGNTPYQSMPRLFSTTLPNDPQSRGSAFGSQQPRFTQTTGKDNKGMMSLTGMSATDQNLKRGSSTYHSTEPNKLAVIQTSSKKSVQTNTQLIKPIKTPSTQNKPSTAPATNEQTHYKLKQKAESYSSKGFGNGFASRGDRFTGVHEAKFQVIAWFRNRGQQKAAKPEIDEKDKQMLAHRRAQTQLSVTNKDGQQQQHMFKMSACNTTSADSLQNAKNPVLESERETQKELKLQSQHDQANNVQQVILANKNKMRSGQYIGRCLKSHLPYPHDVINEELHARELNKQKEIPKHYQTMSCGFKSLQPRLMYFGGGEGGESSHRGTVPSKSGTNSRLATVAPGPGHYETQDVPEQLRPSSIGGKIAPASTNADLAIRLQLLGSKKTTQAKGRNHTATAVMNADLTNLTTHDQQQATQQAQQQMNSTFNTIVVSKDPRGQVLTEQEQILVMNGTACSNQTHSGFNLTQTWQMDQWQKVNQMNLSVTTKQNSSPSKSPERKILRAESTSPGPGHYDTDQQDMASKVTVKSKRAMIEDSHLLVDIQASESMAANITSAGAELFQRSHLLTKDQKEKLQQVLETSDGKQKKQALTPSLSQKVNNLAGGGELAQDHFSISKRLQQIKPGTQSSSVRNNKMAMIFNKPKQMMQSLSFRPASNGLKQPQPGDRLLPPQHSTSTQNFKKTIMENSSRILLGTKPGKKKKKRGYSKDLAIWNTNVSKTDNQRTPVETVPESIDGLKLFLPKGPAGDENGQKLNNYLKKQMQKKPMGDQENKIEHFRGGVGVLSQEAYAAQGQTIKQGEAMIINHDDEVSRFLVPQSSHCSNRNSTSSLYCPSNQHGGSRRFASTIQRLNKGEDSSASGWPNQNTQSNQRIAAASNNKSHSNSKLAQKDQPSSNSKQMREDASDQRGAGDNNKIANDCSENKVADKSAEKDSMDFANHSSYDVDMNEYVQKGNSAADSASQYQLNQEELNMFQQLKHKGEQSKQQPTEANIEYGQQDLQQPQTGMQNSSQGSIDSTLQLNKGGGAAPEQQEELPPLQKQISAPISEDKVTLSGMFKIGSEQSKTKNFSKLAPVVTTNSVVSDYISTLKMHASTIMPKDSLESIEEALTSHNVTNPH